MRRAGPECGWTDGCSGGKVEKYRIDSRRRLGGSEDQKAAAQARVPPQGCLAPATRVMNPAQRRDDMRGSEQGGPLSGPNPCIARASFHWTTTRSDALLPKVSGWYISSALAGGTTNSPGVVARAS